MSAHRPLSVLFAVLLAGCSMSADVGVAERQVVQFHQQLDAGQLQQIYTGASDRLREATSEQDMQALLAAVHRKLGVVKSSVRGAWSVHAGTTGTFVSLSYRTHFSEGDATERFDYQLEGDKALLAGYHINSNTLIEK
ncbi:DUF4019 domain-containing protein [Rhodanobacter sp. Si-c]|uniref:DUF4019 domain-containing protein n=1 Tax=Rhodanobacter lycopersici TaxID=3162487 RepID=A0ABV3QFE7_9GAMM